MDVTSLATSAVAATAQSTRDGFAIAALKIANEQQQMIADFVSQTAETAKAMTEAGIGASVDKVA